MLAILRQCRLARVAVFGTVLAGFLLALALAASPRLHEHLHHAHGEHGEHECLATLLAAGGFDDVLAVVAIVLHGLGPVPQRLVPTQQESLGSFYLACRSLDHAPPLLS